jgi:hypothetical protein
MPSVNTVVLWECFPFIIALLKRRERDTLFRKLI